MESTANHRCTDSYSCFDNHVDAKYIRWAWPLQKNINCISNLFGTLA